MSTENSDLLIATLAPYTYVDGHLVVNKIIGNGCPLGDIVYAMNNHFSTVVNGSALQLGGWDGYLNAKNIRVSYYFAQLFEAALGMRMLAINVFSESDDTFGTISLTSGPTIAFTDGTSYGDGSDTNPANGTYYAATQLKLIVGSMGSNTLDLRLNVKDINNNLITIDVTVPGSSVGGTVINIGSSSDRFLDLTGAIFKPASSNHGTSGDSFTIHNLKERQITL